MGRPAHPPYGGDPVAVVGAGPVGQSAALLLARWGIGVRMFDVLERRERAGSRSICQHRDVLDIWEAVGAGARIAAEGVTWTTARTFYREHELSRTEFRDRGRSPFPPFVNISQSRTEEILDGVIAGEPLVETHWRHEVTGIEQDAGGVTLEVAAPGGVAHVRAPYVVACAGAHGEVLRRALGVGFQGRAFDDQFLICDIRADLPGGATERRFHFDPAWNPGRQVLIHPCPGGVYRIDWQVPPDFDLAAEEAGGGLDARVRAIVGDARYEIVWRTTYRFHARLADRMRVGRVLLAGDLAHLMAPFGARGLNSGVADAENAAWKIAFVLHGWAGDGLLDSYDAERRAAAVENLDVTSETMRFLVPRGAGERAHRRRVLERALHDEAARPGVNSGRLYEPFWYASSPLTTPALSRPAPVRPPAGETPRPAPGVLVPDSPVTLPGRVRARLRETVRDGLLGLACERADVDRAASALDGAVGAPTRILRLPDIDRHGILRQALGARPREIWLVRPDGHVAAVVDGGHEAQLRAAARRALGLAPTRSREEHTVT
jgi:pentachlorophenol monooxygenase/3-(3-hydroxy-phenyl)propionate hydroxylase